MFFLFVLINQTLAEMLYGGEKSQMLAQKSHSAFVGFIWKAWNVLVIFFSYLYSLFKLTSKSHMLVSDYALSILNNKLILYLGYAATTLTSWHLLVTFCSLHIALWMKWFEHKPFDASSVMSFGILNGISIGLLNLSLGFNSVGFYQVGF